MAKKRRLDDWASIKNGKMKNWMKVERAKMKITQDELAKALNVSRYAVIGVESGRYEPTAEFAFRVARFFGKRPEEVFFLDEDELPR